MKLSQREFNAMNNPIRRWMQRMVEYPNFKRLGLQTADLDVLEIGCGSGYGALLLSEQQPRSYLGVDIMPEQINIAQNLAAAHDLVEYSFHIKDATDLGDIPNFSKDVVIIYGIMHHIPRWREVIRECYRVLRRGGKLFVEEPDGGFIETFDRIFHWGHPDNALFRLHELEAFLQQLGFEIRRQIKVLGFGAYVVQKV